MIVREVKQKYPDTIPVFEQYGFRPVCDDCDIETNVRKNGLSSVEVIDALNRAVFAGNAEDKDNASDQAVE
jgi:hypothetical protein